MLLARIQGRDAAQVAMPQQRFVLVVVINHHGGTEHRQAQLVAGLAPRHAVIDHVGRHGAGAVELHDGDPALGHQVLDCVLDRPQRTSDELESVFWLTTTAFWWPICATR